MGIILNRGRSVHAMPWVVRASLRLLPASLSKMELQVFAFPFLRGEQAAAFQYRIFRLLSEWSYHRWAVLLPKSAAP